MNEIPLPKSKPPTASSQLRPSSRYSTTNTDDEVGLSYMPSVILPDTSMILHTTTTNNDNIIEPIRNNVEISNPANTDTLENMNNNNSDIRPLSTKSSLAPPKSTSSSRIHTSSSNTINTTSTIQQPLLQQSNTTNMNTNSTHPSRTVTPMTNLLPPSSSSSNTNNKLFFRNPTESLMIPPSNQSPPSSFPSGTFSQSVTIQDNGTQPGFPGKIVSGIRPGAGFAASLAAASTLPSSASSTTKPITKPAPNLYSNTNHNNQPGRINLDMLAAIVDNNNNTNNNGSAGYSLSPKENITRAISPIDIYQPIHSNHSSPIQQSTNQYHQSGVYPSSKPVSSVHTPQQQNSSVQLKSKKMISTTTNIDNDNILYYNDDNNNPSYDDLANEPEPEISPLPKANNNNTNKNSRVTNPSRIPRYPTNTSPRSNMNIISPSTEKENQQQAIKSTITNTNNIKQSNRASTPIMKSLTNNNQSKGKKNYTSPSTDNNIDEYDSNNYDNDIQNNYPNDDEYNTIQQLDQPQSSLSSAKKVTNNPVLQTTSPVSSNIKPTKRRTLGAGQLARSKSVGSNNSTNSVVLPSRSTIYNTYTKLPSTTTNNTNPASTSGTVNTNKSAMIFTNHHGIVGPDGNIIPATSMNTNPTTLRTNNNGNMEPIPEQTSNVSASILTARGLPAHPDHRSSYILVDHGGKRVAEELNERLIRSEQDKLAFSRKARSVHYTPHTLSDYKAAKEALGMGINTNNNNNSPSRLPNNNNRNPNDTQANSYSVLYSGGSVPPRDTIGIKGKKGIPVGYQELGTLGPDLSSDEIRTAKAARDRQNNYAAEVVANTKHKLALAKAEREQLRLQQQQQQNNQNQQNKGIIDGNDNNNNGNYYMNNNNNNYENELYNDEDNWYNNNNHSVPGQGEFMNSNNNNNNSTAIPTNEFYSSIPSQPPITNNVPSTTQNPSKSNIKIAPIVHKDPAIEARNKANEIRERAKEYAKRVPKPTVATTTTNKLTQDEIAFNRSPIRNNPNKLTKSTNNNHHHENDLELSSNHHQPNQLELLEKQHEQYKQQAEAIRRELSLI